MNPYVVLSPVAGGMFVAGMICLIVYARGLDPAARRKTRTSATRTLESGQATARRAAVIRSVVAVAVGLVVWLLSGWPIAGIGTAAAMLFVPAFFTINRQIERRINRIEALEEWTRRLADAMAVGGSAVATIVGSASRAPEPIRRDVTELASRLSTPWWDRSRALRLFADRIDDGLADYVEGALEVAVSARASERVPSVLRTVADLAADEVRARRQIEVDRAGPRNEARMLVVIAIAVVVFVCLFTSYAAPYSTPVGQAVLGLLGGVLGLSMWRIRTASLGQQTPRILTTVSASDLASSEAVDVPGNLR